MVVKHRKPPQAHMRPTSTHTWGLPTHAMSLFDFKSIYSLEIDAADKPSIDVHDGHLILTAERGEDRIMITAPLSSVLPTATSMVTTVRSGKTKRMRHTRVNVNKGKQLDPSHRAVGENSPAAKLTESSVREIRALAEDKDFVKTFSSKQGMLYDLANAYGIHWTTVWNILNYRSWKHVDPHKAPQKTI